MYILRGLINLGLTIQNKEKTVNVDLELQMQEDVFLQGQAYIASKLSFFRKLF